MYPESTNFRISSRTPYDATNQNKGNLYARFLLVYT